MNRHLCTFVLAALLLPALALAQPVITSITPARTAANIGESIDIYGSGFGSLSDMVTFPNGTSLHPDLLIPGGVRVPVPQTWSGDVTIQAGGTGPVSNGMAHEITWSYLGRKWTSNTIVWYMNVDAAPGVDPDSTANALDAGFQTWTCASGLTIPYGGTTTVKQNLNDGINVCFWDTTFTDPSVIAVCVTTYQGSDIIDADIVFNSKNHSFTTTGTPGSMDIQNIVTHEQGHFIGLGDLYGTADSDKTMYGVTNSADRKKRTLAPEDVEGAEFLYPHSRGNAGFAYPANWSFTVCPQNAPTASPGAAVTLPAILLPGATNQTFVNVALTNNGGDCMSPTGRHDLFVDGTLVKTNRWHGTWAAGDPLWSLNDLVDITAGRHTLEVRLDVDDEYQESDEFDNIWNSQFVWYPDIVPPDSIVYLPAPPPQGSGAWPNSQGIMFSTTGWGVVGIFSNADSEDYDLRLHTEEVTATQGFGPYVASSAAPAGIIDYVVYNHDAYTGPLTYATASVLNYSGNNACKVDFSPDQGVVSAPGTGRLLDYYNRRFLGMESFHLPLGTWNVQVDVTGQDLDLACAVFPPDSVGYSKFDYMAYADNGGAGQDENFTITVTTEGNYGFVVHKKDHASLPMGGTARISVTRTLPNLAAVTPAGWDDALVARNDTLTAPDNVTVSTQLDGLGWDTYFNTAFGLTTQDTVSGGGYAIYHDGVRGSTEWFGMVMPGQPFTRRNLGPYLYEGGRHMTEIRIDPDNLIPESNESDNGILRQYVWTPPVLNDTIPQLMDPPPVNGAAEGFAFPNCDGRVFDWNAYWSAVGILPDSMSADYDIRMYSELVGPLFGFTTYQAWSNDGPGQSDFVLMNDLLNFGLPPGPRRVVGVTDADAPGTWKGRYVMQQADSRAIFSVPDTTSGTWSMAADEVLNMFMINVNPDSLGTYTVELEVLGGSANLGISLYDPLGVEMAKNNYLAWANDNGPGLGESFTYTFDVSWFYGLAVWKTDANDRGKTATYRIRIRAPRPNLAPAWEAGWDFPLVARKDSTASAGNAVMSAGLTGNTAPTWVSLAEVNAGLGATTGIAETRLYLDDQFVRWTSTGPLAAGQGFQALNLGPMTVPGGRHTVHMDIDWNFQVAETDETDNAYEHQWVWSPVDVYPANPVVRPVPPALGLGTTPNCDGLRVPITDTMWPLLVCAICPQDSMADYDLATYDDRYIDTRTDLGYSQVRSQSLMGPGRTDWIGRPSLPWYTEFGATLYQGGTGGYVADSDVNAASRMASVLPATWQADSLVTNRLLNVYQATLPAGDVNLQLVNSAGGADLAVAVQPVSNPADFTMIDAMALIDITRGGGDEIATLTMPAAGDYYLVVFKVGSGDIARDAVYDLMLSSPLSGVNDLPVPGAFALRGNAPNPFNPTTVIRYEVPGTGSPVRLTVFDLSGRRVRVLEDGFKPAGRYQVTWNGKDAAGATVASGAYFCRMEADGFVRTMKMTLLK